MCFDGTSALIQATTCEDIARISRVSTKNILKYGDLDNCHGDFLRIQRPLELNLNVVKWCWESQTITHPVLFKSRIQRGLVRTKWNVAMPTPVVKHDQVNIEQSFSKPMNDSACFVFVPGGARAVP